MGKTHGERLEGIEVEQRALGREQGRQLNMLEAMQGQITQNNNKSDAIRRDMVELINRNHRELMEAVGKRFDHQDDCLDECDRANADVSARVSAIENRSKGALAVLTIVFTSLSGAVIYAFDAIADLMKQGG